MNIVNVLVVLVLVAPAVVHVSVICIQVKKGAAQTEPAWEGAGQHPGIQIWRIVKFQVTEVMD